MTTRKEAKALLELILKDSQNLITEDPAEHVKNLAVFGTSVLIQRITKPTGETYGKSPIAPLKGPKTERMPEIVKKVFRDG